jgi:hypothetical protein
MDKIYLNKRLFLVTSGYLPMTSLLLLMIYNEILIDEGKEPIITDKQSRAINYITTVYDIFFYYEYIEIEKEEYKTKKSESLRIDIIANELGLASSVLALYAVMVEK